METKPCGLNLDAKLYELLNAARSLERKSRVASARIAGSLPEQGKGISDPKPSTPTVHQTVDEILTAVREAAYSVNRIAEDFGISEDVKAEAAQTRY